MITAIIQARMSSSRLPGKVLLDIVGQPLLWHVVSRVARARQIERVVVATSSAPSDQPVADFCAERDIDCFRGSLEDVLDRYYRAAKEFEADPIVRVTGDCPLIDSDVIDHVLAVYREGAYDYVSNALRFTYPEGLEADVFSFDALKRAWRDADQPRQREHVVSYFKYSGLFEIRNVENEDPVGDDHRWVVDEPADLEFVRRVYAELYGGPESEFGMNEVLDLVARRPHLRRMNLGPVRNEGQFKSFADEPALPARELSFDRSEALLAKVAEIMPTEAFKHGLRNRLIVRGMGSHVWDADGNEYIDYRAEARYAILGHGYPAVDEAVAKQIRDRGTFAAEAPLEVAEMLIRIMPGAEAAHFVGPGGAIEAAVQAARAHTGRRQVLRFEHGDLDDIRQDLEDGSDSVAAVLLVPEAAEEPAEYLRAVRDAAARHGVLLIYDETASTFRLSLRGAGEYFDVVPDLSCLGPAIANGYPVSAVVGRRDVLEHLARTETWSAYDGLAIPLAAAKSTIDTLETEGVIGHLWHQARRLKDGLNVLAREYAMGSLAECTGLPTVAEVTFGDNSATLRPTADLFTRECLVRGVLFSGQHAVSYGHTNADIDQTLRVYRTALEVLSMAIREGDFVEHVEGAPVDAMDRSSYSNAPSKS
ncbi:MAG: aminotransferase class III-fold pyridoxal phosphate-dependent enzyme [Chloroflexi bacterium]|nr:aminotransferase class III-fold pyridoxal phosphate-dependent enzyme [Chloroflexota bacterium]